MALKFLNKKGWHTGSLRNIENVWKAEQKHDAEQRKLEELRKQIHEERERAEFRLLQQQAGLVPKQERLDFLYESGLGVGKASSSEGFKALEKPLPSDSNPAASSSSSSSSSKQQEASVPGALFEEKRQSSNDAWRKLHSDPLLMIRQREQEALARVKNNPVQMAMIRRSVEGMKHKEKSDKKELKKERHRRKSVHRKHSSSKYRGDSESDYLEGEDRKNSSNKMCSNYENHIPKRRLDESSEGRHQRKKHCDDVEHPRSGSSDLGGGKGRDPDRSNKKPSRSSRGEFSWEGRADHDASKTDRDSAHLGKSDMAPGRESLRRPPRSRLSEEERAARLREMLVDAELHEEQRWKRLRKAEEEDAQEAIQEGKSGGRNFLDAAQKSIYGAEKGGCSTIEESVRRRTHYSQGNSDSNGGNAFRR